MIDAEFLKLDNDHESRNKTVNIIAVVRQSTICLAINYVKHQIQYMLHISHLQ